jgi:hypothetical protein
LLNEFSKLISPIHKQISFNKKQEKILAKTRDLLLPKFMTGKIRVPVGGD